MNKKTKYRELSWSVQVGLIGGWIWLIWLVTFFLIGFMEGWWP